MALVCLMIVFFFAGNIYAAGMSPFPPGYDMGSQQALVSAAGVSVRQPWTPACYMAGIEGMGLSLFYVDFYDDMDNLEDENIRETTVGGYCSFRRTGFKLAAQSFDAMDIYFEQKVFFSAALYPFGFFGIGIEAQGLRAFIVSAQEEDEKIAHIGMSLFVPVKSGVSFSLGCKNIEIEGASKPGFSKPFIFYTGIHAANNRLGSQGVRLEMRKESGVEYFRFYAAEEIMMGKLFGLVSSIATNPFQISFGLLFRLPAASIYGAVNHHPVLGWSKGVGMECYKER